MTRSKGGEQSTLRGGGGKEDRVYAQRIMVGVRKTGHPLKLDKITKGDNNCFFNAVFDQIQRLGVAQELAGEEPIWSPHDLRLKVARFAKESGLPVVDRFKRVYYETYPPEFWDGFWNRMEQDEEWADGIVGQLTAWFLHHDIHIVMACGAEQTFFGREEASFDKTTILLGYLNNIHYQSLLPMEDADFPPPTSNPLSSSEIRKMVSEAHKKEKQMQKEKGEESPPKKAKLAAAEEDTDWSFNFEWNSKNLSMKPAKEKGWICPICQSEEKQIMGHIKAKHTNPSQKQIFAEVEKNFKKHSHNKRNQASQKKQKEVDEERFKQQHNKAEQARKKRLKEDDEEGFKKQQRESEQAGKKRRLSKDPKKFKKLKKQADQKYKITQRGSRAAAVKKFFQETLYCPVFECVCCRTLNFKHNVVGFNKQTRTQIMKKAKDAHSRDYNCKLEQVNISVLVSFEIPLIF